MIRALKFLGKGLAALLVLAVVGLNVLYWTDPLYYRRMASTPFIDPVSDIDWYRPLEKVAGDFAAPLPRAADGARTINAEAWHKALAYAKQTETYGLMVWHKGAVQYEYYSDGFAPDDRTDTASMHKSVVALMLGAAIADGLIGSVDDPVAKYVPEWAGDARAKITLRHLLHMASGLARQPFSLSPTGEFMRLNVGTAIEPLTLSIQPGVEPGTVFSYYNFNPQMLAIVLQRVTGKRYADYLSQRLWRPLGARDGYVYLDRAGGLARTYCCLHASPEDWLRVGLLHLNRGRVGAAQVLPEDWMAQVTAPSPLNPNYGYLTWLGTTYEDKRSYGAGVDMRVPQSEPFAAPGIVYFDGSGGQRVYIVPSHDMVIVRTGKGGVDFAAGLFKWDESAIPNALIAGAMP
ncbi:MAG: serine hydrolase [Rhodospirillaceae bacterium]|nr:serine hydrolase [Rhodospirillaceae bacterium]